MPVLSNPKHEKYAQELAKGKSQADAYEAAGYKGDRTAASRLATNVNIQARVAELQEKVAGRVVERTSISKEWVIERLIENANRAMQAEAVKTKDGETIGEYAYQGNVANRALELLGKELGMFIDRKEVGKPGDFSELSEDELDAIIARGQGAYSAGDSGEGKAARQKGTREPRRTH